MTTRAGRTPPADWRDVLAAVSALTRQGRGWLSLPMIARQAGLTPAKAANPLAVLVGRGDIKRGTGNGQVMYRLTELGVTDAQMLDGPPGRPAPLGPRHAPRTTGQWRVYDDGAAAADAAWDLTGPWLTHDDMIEHDPYWVHGYWARYHERLPALYARQPAATERTPA